MAMNNISHMLTCLLGTTSLKFKNPKSETTIYWFLTHKKREIRNNVQKKGLFYSQQSQFEGSLVGNWTRILF